jgi:geranylgeranyl diphosphate synthase, type I
VTASDARIATLVEAVDEAIQRMLSSEPTFAGLYDMLRYHHGWLDESLQPNTAPPGKKLRPVLCLLMADTVAQDWRTAVPAAAALEMVHNFSLIHDDIQDRSLLRRYRGTVWAIWGVGQGITAGDALLIEAERVLLESDPPVTADCTLGALRLLNQACRGLCEGQYLDLLWETELNVSVEQYLQMIERKTALLFQCSAELGAFYAGAQSAAQMHAAAYGRNLGMAFQVVDDILGVWGTEAETGKTAALDVTTRKKALPAVLGLSAEPSPTVRLLRALYALDRNLTPAETTEAKGLLDDLGVQVHTVNLARHYRDEAFKSLDQLAEYHDVAEIREFTYKVLPQV